MLICCILALIPLTYTTAIHQAERLSQKWASELEQKLREQEAHYHKELARAMAKLRGVESMVDAVINAGAVQVVVCDKCLRKGFGWLVRKSITTYI